jgi:hypothetical protein
VLCYAVDFSLFLPRAPQDEYDFEYNHEHEHKYKSRVQSTA